MILVETQLTTESTKENSHWYIEGVFAQAAVVNRNKRIYPESVLDREVNSFVNEYVTTNRAVGELSHPNHSHINPDRMAIRITEMEKVGKDYYGKALVLDTPCGKIMQAAMEGGVVWGVSTRGSGTVKSLREGVSEVQEDFKLHTVDSVMNPSAPNALVKSIYENEGVFDSLIHDAVLFEQFCEFLKAKKDAKHIPNRENREAAMVESVKNLFANLIR